MPPGQASGAERSTGCSRYSRQSDQQPRWEGLPAAPCLWKLLPLLIVIKTGKQTLLKLLSLSFSSGLELRGAFKAVFIDLISSTESGADTSRSEYRLMTAPVVGLLDERTVIVFKHKFQKDCFPSLELPFSDVKRFPTEPNTVLWFFWTTVPITHTTQRWQGKASCLTLFCQFSADGGCGCARFLQKGPGRGKQNPQQIAYVSLRKLQLKYKTSSVSLAFSLRVLAENRPAPWYFFLLDKISQILYIR